MNSSGVLPGRLALALALVLASGCHDESAPSSPGGNRDAAADAGSAGDGGARDGGDDAPTASGPPPPDCFKGMPKTNDELLNACWPETVVAVSKTAVLPGGYKVGAQLPAPPPP